MRTKLRTALLLAAALGVAAAACEGERTGVQVSVEPRDTLVARSATQRFESRVEGTFDERVVWSVHQGPGTIDSAGRYTAPPEVPPDEENDVRIRATSIVDGSYAEATLRVVLPPFSPLQGPSKGGTRVTFSGIPLDGAVPVVRFGSLLASGLSILANNAFEVFTPPRYPEDGPTLGSVNVQVQVGDRVYEYPNGFRYGATHVRFPLSFLIPSCDSIRDLRISNLDGVGPPELIASCGVFLIETRSPDRWGGFDEPVRVFSGEQKIPFYLAITDLDLDGDQDVVLTESVDGFVFDLGIFRMGPGGLQREDPIPLPTTVGGLDDLVAADVDRDGYPEILFTDFVGEQIGVVPNDGGVLGVPGTLPGFTGALRLRVGDFDEQLGPDIAVSNTAGIVVLLNDGFGQIGSRTAFFMNLPVYDFISGDFDGDGHLDLAAGSEVCSGDCIQVRLGDGTGGFGPVTPVATSGLVRLRNMFVGDFDSDQRQDVVIQNTMDQQMSVFGGIPGGLAERAAFGGNWGTIAIGDIIDEDVGDDLVAAHQFFRSIMVVPGYLTPKLQIPYPGILPRAHPSQPNRIALLTVRETGQAAFATVRFDEGGTPGDFEEYALPLGFAVSSFLLGDADTDGYADALIAGQTPDLYIAYGKPGGGYDPPVLALSTGNRINTATVSDLDGDGRNDLLLADIDLSGSVTAGYLRVVFGDSAGAFGAHADLDVGEFPAEGLTADLDGDGRPELLVRDLLGTAVRIFTYGSSGSLAENTPITLADVPRGVEVADLDRDGLPDLVIGTLEDFDPPPWDVRVLSYRNLGQLQFGLQNEIVLTEMASYDRTEIADFDADGFLDLVIPIQSPIGFAIARGRGDGSFLPPEPFIALEPLSGFAVLDFDADGLPDIVGPTTSSEIYAHRNISR